MRLTSNRTLSAFIVIVTSLGLLLSLFFIVQIWRFRKPVTEKLYSGIIRTSILVNSSRQLLDIIDQVVNNVSSSTEYLDNSAKTMVQTVDTTSTFIDSADTFLGVDMVNTLTNTQVAIDSAKASAVVIDNLLTTLSRVPLIGIDYNPSQPLNVALGEVSESLNPLQETLKNFQSSLSITQTNMQELKDQILVLEENVSDINRNLEASQLVIDQYKIQLDTFQAWVDDATISLSKWTNTIAWSLTIFVLWVILIQIAILLQALNQLSSPTVEVTEINDQ